MIIVVSARLAHTSNGGLLATWCAARNFKKHAASGPAFNHSPQVLDAPHDEVLSSVWARKLYQRHTTHGRYRKGTQKSTCATLRQQLLRSALLLVPLVDIDGMAR